MDKRKHLQRSARPRRLPSEALLLRQDLELRAHLVQLQQQRHLHLVRRVVSEVQPRRLQAACSANRQQRLQEGCLANRQPRLQEEDCLEEDNNQQQVKEEQK